MKNTGFTFFELLIGIAVLGITAAIAIPAYQSYLVKAKVAEALISAGPYQVAVSECYQTMGGLNGCSSGTNGIPTVSSANFGSLTATDGQILFTFNDQATPIAQGSTLTLAPRTTGVVNAITWDCSSSLNGDSLPTGCQSVSPPVDSRWFGFIIGG